jgi:hypothetical protein
MVPESDGRTQYCCELGNFCGRCEKSVRINKNVVS